MWVPLDVTQVSADRHKDFAAKCVDKGIIKDNAVDLDCF